MLELVDSFVGGPSSDVHVLTLPDEILLVYGFSDSVVLLDAESLAFKCALAFWDVFPSVRESGCNVERISIEPGMKLIVASSGPHVAVWSLSGVQRDAWHVHSSLTMPDRNEVTAMDCKSGLLAVGTAYDLSVYHLSLEDDLIVWTQKWTMPSVQFSVVRFSPSLGHLATVAPDDRIVRVYSTVSGRQTQVLRHPRPVRDFIWRFSSKSSRDDLVLYTITSDSTLRIFLPVLDTPQYLQLHATLDQYSSTPGWLKRGRDTHSSNVFWLHNDTMTSTLTAILKSKGSNSEDTQVRRIKEMYEGGWDCFARVFDDGSMVVKAVANIDRRPPTLLRQFDMLHLPPTKSLPFPSRLHILTVLGAESLVAITSSPLRSFILDPLSFFDGRKEGLCPLAKRHSSSDSEKRRIRHFVRTPDGRGLASVRDGCVECWNLSSGRHQLKRLESRPSADQVAVVDGGRRIVIYDEAKAMVTVYPEEPPLSLSVPPLESLFCLPSTSNYTIVIGIARDSSILRMRLSNLDQDMIEFRVLDISMIPLDGTLWKIIPVDPMAWSFSRPAEEVAQVHDILQTITTDGELSFWAYDDDKHKTWVRSGRVRTNGREIRSARCSSAKKTALVSSDVSGEELTIWDSKVSEFASGLEFTSVFNDTINDLDWTSTPDAQSVLAVGFSHHILLLCQQRMTYFNEEPAWGVLGRLDIGQMLPHPISDSMWLSGGTLVVGAGSHILQYGQGSRRLHETVLTQKQKAPERRRAGLFEEVAKLNGPLPDYHPQMILQCLLWGKTELVKEIIVKLDMEFRLLSEQNSTRERFQWTSLPVEGFWEHNHEFSSLNLKQMSRRQYSILFDGPDQSNYDDDDSQTFSTALVHRVINEIEAEPLASLSPNENAHLSGLVQAVLEADEQRRALDENGFRYLVSLRSFYILNARAVSPGVLTPESASEKAIRQPPQNLSRERLRYRDMIWAFHSESQEILLSESTAACGNKMVWADAKATGVFLWLNSAETLKVQMEEIARNQYMSGDARDPTACSLFYFALGKVRLVHGLWRQAVWHKEQNLMLRFLSNDFTVDRWKTAALKNAYALLGKQRFEYAAAFFLLGGGLRDAVNVIIKHLNDFQLAIALVRVLEQGDERPIFNDVLNNVVVPLAFRKGNRWLASWAFWHLKRRDLAVRILVSPLKDIANALWYPVTDIGDPNYDDPSLALLFAQLKEKTLQTAKGTSEISGQTEFNFVLQTARVFCRMGCHALAVNLVHSWSFDRSSTVVRAHPAESKNKEGEDEVAPMKRSSPVMPRRSISPTHMRRRSTMVIDMVIPSDPSTRPTSPVRVANDTDKAQDPSRQPPPQEKAGTGLGSLMKAAKQNVTVPEFDMGAFF